jgi:CPA2 family monovalent cation:H+ antiporter-2
VTRLSRAKGGSHRGEHDEGVVVDAPVPLLDELAIVAAVAVAVTLLLARVGMPTVAGLLLAGAVVGPYGFALATSVRAIEAIAEVGVVLLLFSVGLELSLARLRDVMRRVALGGVLQVGLTTGAVAAVAAGLGARPGAALFYGFAFALSSTAIVLRALADRREIDAPHGRFLVGTLLFQDLCVVPMGLVVPRLGPGAAGPGAAIAIVVALAKAAVVVAGTLVVARKVVPRALARVDASRSREVFLLAILALCIGTAWLTARAGLSLALGAFLAGLLVADTEYGHRATGDLLPLRDAFVSVFFVSLGMLFDVRVVVARPLACLGLLFGFVVGKALLGTIAALAMRFPARVAWLAGVGLAQFGELGFVLTRLAEANGVVAREATGPLFAAGVLSMFLTPLLVRAAPHVRAGERLLAPLERVLGVRAPDDEGADEAPPTGHVVLIGLGLAGLFVARAIRSAGAELRVLELNAGNVRRGRALGLPVTYADATSEEALAHANVAGARLVVLLINDPAATERAVATVRRVAPDAPVLVRARYFLERDRLVALGARDVVAEEVEGTVEIVSRVLGALGVPADIVAERLREVRAETLPTARDASQAGLGGAGELAGLRIERALVRDRSPIAGTSAAALRLRSRTGALVVGVRRGDDLLEEPDPTVPFEPGDVVYFAGTVEAIRRATALCDGAATR